MNLQNYTQQTSYFPFHQRTQRPHKPKAVLYNPFTHKPRSLKAQSLLEAVLELLRVEAKAVGMEAKALNLANKLLNKTNTPHRE